MNQEPLLHVDDLTVKLEGAQSLYEVIEGFRESLQRGLLTMSYFPRIRINPPLVITEDQANAGADILDEVFAHIRDKVDWREAS